VNHRPAGRRALVALGLTLALLGATTRAEATYQAWNGYNLYPRSDNSWPYGLLSGAIACTYAGPCLTSTSCTNQLNGWYDYGTEATALKSEIYSRGKVAVAANQWSALLYVRANNS